jgi:hypothetical protein
MLKRPSREDLVDRVVKLAKLKKSGKTAGYLTRSQTVELIAYLETMNAKLEGANGRR